VPVAFGESLVAARNFRRNKETHIWKFHYRGSAVSGSRCIKQIYTAPDCHKRHAACRGARHRDRAFVAVKRIRAPQADRFHNFAPRRSPRRGKRRKIYKRATTAARRGRGGKEEGRGWSISRERARKPAATPTSSSSPAMRGHREVKRLPARGVDG